MALLTDEQITGLMAENAELAKRAEVRLDALRKLAILEHHRMTEGGGTVISGYSCEVCEAECGPRDHLIHVGDCPLTILNPPT